jgi:predicted Fe-Mo cluster-binding NifX family protein
MKIGIALMEKNIEKDINQTFARAPYFAIYNSDNKEVVYFDNAAKEASGGAGVKAAQFFVDNNVDAIIAYRLGDNAVQVLTKSNIKLFAPREELNAINNINLLIDNELNTLVDIHSGYHHG